MTKKKIEKLPSAMPTDKVHKLFWDKISELIDAWNNDEEYCEGLNELIDSHNESVGMADSNGNGYCVGCRKYSVVPGHKCFICQPTTPERKCCSHCAGKDCQKKWVANEDMLPGVWYCPCHKGESEKCFHHIKGCICERCGISLDEALKGKSCCKKCFFGIIDKKQFCSNFDCPCHQKESETVKNTEEDYLIAAFDPIFNIFQIEAVQKGERRYIEANKKNDILKIKEALDSCIKSNPDWFE